MKKVLLVLLLSIVGLTALGCGDYTIDPDGNLPREFEDRIHLDNPDGCNGSGDYLVINGVCITKEDLLSPNIEIRQNRRIATNMTSGGEKLDDYIADLSNSQGIGVVSRDVFESQKNSQASSIQSLDLSSTNDDITENVIVKLTEEGFFEEVSFTDYYGNNVEIKSNPIAFEVYGSFSVVVFDVEFFGNYERDFMSRIWDAYHAGAFYLIHNETGKIFPLFNIITEEESSTYENRYFDIVTLKATVGEVLTREVYKDGETTIETLTDRNGNPIIFDEGPIITTIELFPVIEYYEVLVRDDDGEPVLDDEGEPVYELVEEAILDNDGNQLYEEIEVAVLDDNGNPLRKESFEVTVEVQMIEQVTEIRYYQEIEEGPLSDLARRIADRIFADYYNWNYYRVSNFQIDYGNLIFDKDTIFYQVDNHSSTTHERIVMQLTYDPEEGVVLLEEFINLSRANLDTCGNIFLDPVSNLLICFSYNNTDNLQIYSSTEGLLEVPDSNTFRPVTLPNGQLYFRDNNSSYIEELGYNSDALHKITPDGSLVSTLIELGFRQDICRGEWCSNSIDATFIDAEGNKIEFDNHNYFQIRYLEDQPYIESANVELITLDFEEATRPECDQENGCYVVTLYELYQDDLLIATYRGYNRIYPGQEVPPAIVKYELTDKDTIDYQYSHSNNDKVCENDDIGCQDEFYLQDTTMENNNVWVWHNRIIQSGEKFIQRFMLEDNTNVEREYVREFKSGVCTNATCERNIVIHFYGEDDELVAQTNMWMQFVKDDLIPLRIEYRVNDDTVIERGDTCVSDVCGYNFEIFIEDDGTHWIYSTIYKNDSYYTSLEYTKDSKVTIYEETVEREVCLNTNGCSYVNIEYYVNDSNGDLLYEMVTNYRPGYGDTAPFSVTVSIDDLNTHYQKEYSQEPKICENSVCANEHSLLMNHDHLGWGTMMISEGDQFINNISLASNNKPIEESFLNVCSYEWGCALDSNNVIVQDAEGNQISKNAEDIYFNVYFAMGEAMPIDSNFKAVYELTDITYQYSRIEAYGLRLHNDRTITIDNNTFFIDNSNDTWLENYIMYYIEETNRYRGVSTNLISMHETHAFGDGFIGVNRGKTAIYYIEMNPELSNENMMYFDMTNLTDGHRINAIENIMISYDGTIYFDAIDNFIQDLSGTISPEGEIILDTTYIEREVIRIRPLN